MWKVREMVDKATNLVMNYTDTESKVRDATNDDPWGPSGAQMQEVASFTFTYESFPEAMGMLWKRLLQDNRSNWRRTYKSLLLLDYLIKNGSERVVTSAREHIYDLRSLENYTFVDDNGKDQGVNIRHKVSDMIEFIQDDDRLRDERKKAKKNKDKYVGMSNESMGFKGGFDSSWQDKFPSSGITGGSWGKEGNKSKGGYQDNSDEDDNAHRGYSPEPASEYRDSEVTDDNKGFSSIKESSTTNNNQLTTTADTNKTTGGDKKPLKLGNKIRKPIDLGAAATFAARAQPSTQQLSTNEPQSNNVSNKTTTNFDLFATDQDSGDFNSQQQQPSSLVITGDDEFDPRGLGSIAPSKKSASNGNFGFGNAVNSSNTEDGDFADFTSAFGGKTCDKNTTKNDQNLFGSGIPAPPSPKETPGEFDLFGATTSNNSNNTNETKNSALVDLLGGFGSGGGSESLTSMPNLMNAPPLHGTTGIQQPSLFGGPTTLIGVTGNTSLPPLQPTSTINAFQPPHQPNPSALIDSPILAPSQQILGIIDTKLDMAASGADESEKKASKLPSTWNDVAGLHMDLANFSLSNPTQKKAAMSMNSMKMSTSSSKSPSPLSPMGKGGFPAPAAPTLKPQPGPFDLL